MMVIRDRSTLSPNMSHSSMAVETVTLTSGDACIAHVYTYVAFTHIVSHLLNLLVVKDMAHMHERRTIDDEGHDEFPAQPHLTVCRPVCLEALHTTHAQLQPICRWTGLNVPGFCLKYLKSTASKTTMTKPTTPATT